MIRTSLCLYDFHTFILAQFPNNHPDIRSNLPIYHLSSIFWGEDYMILTVPFCVGQAVCFFFFLFLPFFCAMIPLYSFTPFLYTHRALSAFCKYILFLDNYILFVEEYNFNSLNIFLHFVNSLYFPFTGAYAHPSADTESECLFYQIPV